MNNVWVFDIDGVLTNLDSRHVSEQLIAILAKINAGGEPIAFVTGRAYAWVEERIIGPLNKHGTINFDIVLSSCEKGGVKVTYENGKPSLKIKEELKVPDVIKTEAKALVEAEFTRTMMFDAPKYTMISIEARENVAIEEFRRDQKVLDEKLKEMINKHSLQDILRLDSTTISTDVENENCGKGAGAADFLDWTREKSINPGHVYTFGDRQSDIEVPTLLQKNGLDVTSVFTGGKQELETRDVPFKLVVTKQLHDKGALSFLRDTIY